MITSRNNGTTYALNIYLPPASAGARTSLPVIYVLDGDWWFSMIATIAQIKQSALIIVGINTMGQRAHDYVPPNTCTPDGGGNVAYLAFLRDELLPYIEGTYGGTPRERTLFGHSHGGSFVFYALFAEAPGQHSFKTYLPSDASLDCMPSESTRWEQAYASAYTDLPVRLHQSYASIAGNFVANAAYAFTITQRNYGRLTFTARPYQGSHTGILPEVLDDAIGYAVAGGP
jgi:enterochelin esterase-like enzyme